jgi:hypothetical protein
MTMLCRFRCRFWVRIIYPNVSTVYNEQGQHDKVKEMNEKALQIRVSVLGENHSDVATSYGDMAAINGRQGNFDKDLETHEKLCNFVCRFWVVNILIWTRGDYHLRKVSIDSLVSVW